MYGKGGSLSGLCPPALADCQDGHLEQRTYAGTLSLPFKNLNGLGEKFRSYAFEWTVEDYVPCAPIGSEETFAAYSARSAPADRTRTHSGHYEITRELARWPDQARGPSLRR